MLRKLLTENFEVDQGQLAQHIYRSLEEIQQKLQEEIINKQRIVDTQLAQLAFKDDLIQKLEAVVLENQHNIDGNRQLINKLLNDLDRMQQDIEWYKRTYETRTIWGVIKQKIIPKRPKY